MGGIESAFMSTTFDRAVAMHYAAGVAGAPALVFEMQMGMIDRGAELGWISQVGGMSPRGILGCSLRARPCAEPGCMAPRSTRTRKSASLRR
jgi:hypothetical protein